MRKERIKLNYNQKKFSEILKIDRAYYSKIENGKANITLELLCRICNSLDVDLFYIMKEDNDDE